MLSHYKLRLPLFTKKQKSSLISHLPNIFNTQMWKEIKNYLLPVQNWMHSCSASPTHSPLNLFPRFPLTSSQWHLTTDTAFCSLSCLRHHYLSLSLPPYVHIYLTLCALLSLNYSWRDRKALPTFILHDSTHSQVISAISSNISMLSTFRSLSYTPLQTKIWAYF